MSLNHNAAKRIIVIGASGVGKTSLVEMLAPLIALPIIPELGRQICIDMGYEQVGNVPDQEGFKRKVLEEQIKAEETHGSFVSDRSTIDCWVLWQRWIICKAMTYDTESYHDRCRQQSTKYTHIIYIPPMFPAPEDGFRWTDADYQKQVDRIVRMTLYDWNLWNLTYVIKSDTLAHRTQEVIDWLKN